MYDFICPDVNTISLSLITIWKDSTHNYKIVHRIFQLPSSIRAWISLTAGNNKITSADLIAILIEWIFFHPEFEKKVARIAANMIYRSDRQMSINMFT